MDERVKVAVRKMKAAGFERSEFRVRSLGYDSVDVIVKRYKDIEPRIDAILAAGLGVQEIQLLETAGSYFTVSTDPEMAGAHWIHKGDGRPYRAAYYNGETVEHVERAEAPVWPETVEYVQAGRLAPGDAIMTPRGRAVIPHYRHEPGVIFPSLILKDGSSIEGCYLEAQTVTRLVPWTLEGAREALEQTYAFMSEPRSIGEADRLYEEYEMASDTAEYLRSVIRDIETLTGRIRTLTEA